MTSPPGRSPGPLGRRKASGVNSAVREVGGLLGVALLASVFASAGGYASPQAFVDGLVPATAVAPASSAPRRS